MDEGEGVELLTEIGSQVLQALEADSIRVKLQNGKVVEGAVVHFMVKRKVKKGEVCWSGRLSVETESGVLDMECSNILSVDSR